MTNEEIEQCLDSNRDSLVALEYYERPYVVSQRPGNCDVFVFVDSTNLKVRRRGKGKRGKGFKKFSQFLTIVSSLNRTITKPH